MVRPVAWLVTALFGAQLAWLAVTAAAPQVRQQTPGWLAWLSAPGSAGAMTVTMALALGALALLLSSRPPATDRVPLLASAWFAAGAVPLSVAAYAPCAGDSPGWWNTITSTLTLFLGNLDEPFGPGQACGYPLPLGLHVARLLALLATVSGATSVLFAVSRAQLDRWALRRARQLVVIAGVDEASWDLAEALGRREAGRRTVLFAPDANPATTERARSLGMLVVASEPDLPDKGWGRVSRVYLLAADPSTNLLRAEHVLAKLAVAAAPGGGPAHLVVRIDDPWQADDWRKQRLGDPAVACDAVGVYEATAQALIERVTLLGARQVLIVGSSPLSLALCGGLSQLGRELEFLGEGGSLPGVTVVGDRASDLVDDHRVLQRRFAVDPLSVTAVDADPVLSAVVTVLAEPAATAVVVTTGEHLGTQLAVRYPRLPVFVQHPGGSAGIGLLPTLGTLLPFGLSLVGGQGIDAWERAARTVHERYRRRFPRAALAVPWEQLPEFYRESNRRQLAVVRQELVALGRSWRPTSSDDAPAATEAGEPASVVRQALTLLDLTADELDHLARAEHASWLRHYEAGGWHPGPRNEAAKTHPDLVGWEGLSQPARDKAAEGVVDTLLQLRALGHRAVLPTREWEPFERVGVVTAHKLLVSHPWQAAGGERLVGRPGDWLVVDDTGGERTVTDPSFRATHTHLKGDRWQRSSRVLARRVRPGEVVRTQEGLTTTDLPGWVVRDEDDNRWIVPEEHFRQAYREPPTASASR